MLQDVSVHRDWPVKNYRLAAEFAEPCCFAYHLNAHETVCQASRDINHLLFTSAPQCIHMIAVEPVMYWKTETGNKSMFTQALDIVA